MVAGSIEAIICSYTAWSCADAIAVARCESGTDANGNLDGNWASNGVSYGVYQLAPEYHPIWTDFWDTNADGTPNWADPTWNIDHAFSLWSTSGWSPWSCAP